MLGIEPMSLVQQTASEKVIKNYRKEYSIKSTYKSVFWSPPFSSKPNQNIKEKYVS